MSNPIVGFAIVRFTKWSWFRDGLVILETRYSKITAQARNFSMRGKNIGITADNGKFYDLNEASARGLIAPESTLTKPELVALALDYDLTMREQLTKKSA